MKNDPHSCESNLRNYVRSLRKIQDFDGVWTRDLAIPVRCSNQLSYEANDVGSWSIMCPVPVKEMNVIDVYEINHKRTAEMKSNEEWSVNIKKSGKHVTIGLSSDEIKPMTSQTPIGCPIH